MFRLVSAALCSAAQPRVLTDARWTSHFREPKFSPWSPAFTGTLSRGFFPQQWHLLTQTYWTLPPRLTALQGLSNTAAGPDLKSEPALFTSAQRTCRSWAGDQDPALLQDRDGHDVAPGPGQSLRKGAARVCV